MKDRLKRTNTKKVSHALKNTSIIFGGISFLTTILLTIFLVNVNISNNTLSDSIDNYQVAKNNTREDVKISISHPDDVRYSLITVCIPPVLSYSLPNQP